MITAQIIETDKNDGRIRVHALLNGHEFKCVIDKPDKCCNDLCEGPFYLQKVIDKWVYQNDGILDKKDFELEDFEKFEVDYDENLDFETVKDRIYHENMKDGDFERVYEEVCSRTGLEKQREYLDSLSTYKPSKKRPQVL